MWSRQFVLTLVGLCGGATIAAGLFALVTTLGVVSDFADRTHTGKYVLFYGDCLVAGGILGNVVSIYHLPIPGGVVTLGLFGLLSGLFVGCWTMAIAEVLHVFPIFIRRAKIIKGIPYLIIGLALGKAIGTFLYAWNGWG